MAESPPRDVALWLQRWRARLAEGEVVPEDEARLVIASVLDSLDGLDGGHPEELDRAGRAWGRSHRSVSEMVGHLSRFRETLVASGMTDPLRMHWALDRVTVAATEEVLHRLERASRTDALTGVGNRRALDETLSASLSAAARQGHEVTVVAIDLDGLKRINDTEGHAAGDAALLALVRAFYLTLRDEDTVFRSGGDEFVVLLPFTSVGTAEVLMGRIRASGAPAFTWGAAGFPADGSDARAVMEAADQELYRRRQSGIVAVRAPVRSAPATRAGQRALRWLWLPAAAVLVASLVATLVSAASAPERVTAGRPVPPATRAGHGAAPLTTTTAPPRGPAGATAASGAPTGVNSAGTGIPAPALTASNLVPAAAPTPPSVGGPGGVSGSPGSGGPPAPSGGGGGGSQPPSQGGVFGVAENALAPVPVVGGGNGLIAVIGHVLTG